MLSFKQHKLCFWRFCKGSVVKSFFNIKYSFTGWVPKISRNFNSGRGLSQKHESKIHTFKRKCFRLSNIKYAFGRSARVL